MDAKTLLSEAIKLKPHERISLVEQLIKSLDEPNKTIDEIWADESEKRLQAYREGKIQGIPFEEVFHRLGSPT